jgi:hypothetical protein
LRAAEKEEEAEEEEWEMIVREEENMKNGEMILETCFAVIGSPKGASRRWAPRVRGR